MRLQRRGPVIYYSFAPKGSDEFRLVTHRPVGTNDVMLIKIQADASDAVGGAEFILKSLSIQAAKIIRIK